MSADVREIERLRLELAETRQRLDELASQVAALGSGEAWPPPPGPRLAAPEDPVDTAARGEKETQQRRFSRRGLLGLAAAGAGGLTLAGVTAAEPAAASDPNDITIGQVNTNAGAVPTSLNTTGNVHGAQVLIQQGNDFAPSDSEWLAALGAWASGVGTGAVGLYAYSDAGGPAVAASASGGPGLHVTGSPHLRFNRQGVSGAPTFDSAAQLGDLVQNDDGLWMCVGEGGTGKWSLIAGPGVAGAFHPIAPVRVYNSKLVGTKQRIAKGATRTIYVGDQIDSAGAVSTHDVVPVGATAIVANLLALDTSSSGFLAVTPTGGHSSTTLHWTASNSSINNGITTKITAGRQIAVYASNVTHFVIDVSGYYL